TVIFIFHRPEFRPGIPFSAGKQTPIKSSTKPRCGLSLIVCLWLFLLVESRSVPSPSPSLEPLISRLGKVCSLLLPKAVPHSSDAGLRLPGLPLLLAACAHALPALRPRSAETPLFSQR
ncbi:hypothetical protein EMPG_09918, partial [Blastomyces silverae]